MNFTPEAASWVRRMLCVVLSDTEVTGHNHPDKVIEGVVDYNTPEEGAPADKIDLNLIWTNCLSDLETYHYYCPDCGVIDPETTEVESGEVLTNCCDVIVHDRTNNPA